MNNTDKKEEPRYKCAECGIAVIVLGEEIFRPCTHKDSGVTAECIAECYGDSDLVN